MWSKLVDGLVIVSDVVFDLSIIDCLPPHNLITTRTPFFPLQKQQNFIKNRAVCGACLLSDLLQLQTLLAI